MTKCGFSTAVMGMSRRTVLNHTDLPQDTTAVQSVVQATVQGDNQPPARHTLLDTNREPVRATTTWTCSRTADTTSTPPQDTLYESRDTSDSPAIESQINVHSHTTAKCQRPE